MYRRRRPTVLEHEPHPVDVHVGARVRQRRREAGLSQGALAEAVGLTFQQIQKYERGANRVSASRLYHIGRALGVPIDYFFDGMSDDLEGRGMEQAPGLDAQSTPAYDIAPAVREETLDLVRIYYRIPDPSVRNQLFELVKCLADDADDN